MKLYFSYSRIPELAGLTPLQRKLAYQCGLEAFFAEQPSFLWRCSGWVFGSLLGGTLAGWVAASRTGLAGSNHKLLIILSCGLAGVIAGSLIGNHILHTQLRPYLRRVIEERAKEIAQIK